MLATDRYVALVAGVGGLALLSLAAAVVARSQVLVAWAVAFGGAEYAVFLALRGDTVDAWAPIVGAALFFAAELGCRATERADAAPEISVVARSMAALFGCVVAVAALGAVLLALAGGAEGGLGLEALGVAAAVVALALLVALAARTAAR